MIGGVVEKIQEIITPSDSYKSASQKTPYPVIFDNIPVKIGIAISSVSLASICFVLLNSFFGYSAPFLLFFTAVIISSWFGGAIAGISATVLSTATIFVFSIMYGEASIITTLPRLNIVMFNIEGFVVSICMQSMHNAINQHKIKHDDLQKSEARYRHVVDAIEQYSIYSLDMNGYVTNWSAGASKIKQYAAFEVIGKHYSIFFPEEEIQKRKPWNAIKTAQDGGVFVDESYKIRKNGEKFWASTVVSPIRDESGKIYGFSVISHDMSERKEQEKRKHEFISIASHELKTPVTSLKVFTQVLIKHFVTSHDKNPIKYLHKMDVQLDRLSMLVNDLLDVSRIQTGKIALRKEEFDFNELVAETVENIQGLSTVHRFTIKGKILDPIVGDKDRLSQVLINFFTNAIKYSPDSEEIVVSLSQDGARALISIQDDGIGIPVEYRNKIFERFFRINNNDNNNFPGLGMGLYISSEIIKRHNGSVWVESEKGLGSTFYFTLPIQHTKHG